MKKLFSQIKQSIVLATILILPFFVLPTTQEFIITSKLYLLSLIALSLLIISTVELLITKKFVWKKMPFDIALFLLIIATLLSTLVSSPNKIQAITSLNFGLLGITSLFILYLYASRLENAKEKIDRIFSLLAFVVSLLTIVFFFQPFRFFALPSDLSFLKNSLFSPVGTQLDLAILLGFFLVYEGIKVARRLTSASWWKYSLVFVILVALSLTLLRITKPAPGTQQTALIMPPFDLSWYAAVETLKNPLNAVFGVGVDNFSAVFTRVKDLSYVQSNLWQINSFSVSRSTLLHVLTETGIFGLLTFLLTLFILLKNQIFKKELAALYIILIILFFPPTFPLLFLFFVFLASQSTSSDSSQSNLDLANFLPLALTIGLVSLALILAASYFLGRSYVAEYLFKRSLDGYLKNDVRALYDNQRRAASLNPFSEKYRINFSQTNILIANNVAAKATSSAELSAQDRQIITQAIQAAIAEAKATVTLNPQKAQNWENMAIIYRNIISVAENADTWTVSSYQRAVVLDPQNPNYRLNLGGVYYQLGNFDEAIKMFEQTIALKPNWANAHYNLAWAAYQKKDFQRAATEMKTALSLLNPNQDQADYQRAENELEQFKKKLSSP